MFIGVMTNALFGAIAALAAVRAATNRIILLAVNVGLVLFLIGLSTDTTILKQIGTPIMGLALLYGIATYFQSLGSSRASTAR